MQFKVPQFIDVEDKLFGPFTFRQFVYLAGGAGLIYVIYRLLPLWIGIFLILPVGALAGLLTFYKINNKPFIYYLQAALTYGISNKLYVWKQRLAKPADPKKDASEILPESSVLPIMSSNKLRDISWSLDINEKSSEA